MSEWISVYDRLPEENGDYLTARTSKWRDVLIDVLSFAKDLHKTGYVDFEDYEYIGKAGWYDYDSDWGYYDLDSVTHWMPLPEPPKAGV